ncbi:MAG: SdpI family protein [Lachnospiraceae bacterium]|nr:SdpI family protein [Lachnospiraceae bacterium]
MKKILWTVTFIPLMITLFLVRYLPDKIPGHYDAMGNIDRWGSKYEILIMPIVIIFMTAFWHILIWKFENSIKKSSDDKIIKGLKSNIKVLYIAAYLMLLQFFAIHMFFVYSAFESTDETKVMVVDINYVMNIMIGIVLVIFGNYLPKTRRNSLVGFRTYITMKSEQNWKKCNKFAGIVMMIAGIVIIFLSLIFGEKMSTILMILVILLALTVSLLYASKCDEGEKE